MPLLSHSLPKKGKKKFCLHVELLYCIVKTKSVESVTGCSWKIDAGFYLSIWREVYPNFFSFLTGTTGVSSVLPSSHGLATMKQCGCVGIQVLLSYISKYYTLYCKLRFLNMAKFDAYVRVLSI